MSKQQRGETVSVLLKIAESVKRFSSAVFCRQRINGSNICRSIAPYFFPGHIRTILPHSAKARTRSFGTEHSLLVMMYSTVLSGSQLYAATEELLRGNRGHTRFLVVLPRLFRDALANDEFSIYPFSCFEERRSWKSARTVRATSIL